MRKGQTLLGNLLCSLKLDDMKFEPSFQSIKNVISAFSKFFDYYEVTLYKFFIHESSNYWVEKLYHL